MFLRYTDRGGIALRMFISFHCKGQPGLPGLPGAHGIDGCNGVDGCDGEDGLQGEDGARGPDGYRGPRGPNGEPRWCVLIALSCLHVTPHQILKLDTSITQVYRSIIISSPD